jgi:hypothetical protein
MQDSHSERHGYLDPKMTSRGSRQPAVAGEQRGAERLREGDIDGVIGGEIAPQLPDTRQKKIMRISPNRKVREIGERLIAAFSVDLAGGRIPAKNLRHFDVDEMRRVQRFPRLREKAHSDRLRCRCPKQDLDQCGCVDDDHRRSRSARTASAGATEGVTADRRSRRLRKSSIVGRRATSRISPSK